MSTAERIARLSAREIADAALGPHGQPLLRRAITLAFAWPSRRLGRTLARFDARVAEAGLARAASETLARLGARVRAAGEVPRGAALVVVNHPGAYDALALMTALGRDDVVLVAGERAFLRALEHVARHLAFVDGASSSAGVKRALRTLHEGGIVVQFGAGAIEPDVAFDTAAEPLGVWRNGTGLLANRALAMGAAVVPAFVSGVHSPRAKRLALVRWAERRGTTTIAPLVQATTPGFRDVTVDVRFGAPVDRAAFEACPEGDDRTAFLRAAVRGLSAGHVR